MSKHRKAPPRRAQPLLLLSRSNPPTGGVCEKQICLDPSMAHSNPMTRIAFRQQGWFVQRTKLARTQKLKSEKGCSQQNLGELQLVRGTALRTGVEAPTHPSASHTRARPYLLSRHRPHAQHTRTPLHPEALASVPYGIVLVRVRVRQVHRIVLRAYHPSPVCRSAP